MVLLSTASVTHRQPQSQAADTQFWIMGCAPKTSINLSTCFSKEGSLKWFCAHWKLAPENETEWRKAGSQFNLGRWRSLTSRGGKTSTCVCCLYLQRRNRRQDQVAKGNRGSQVLPQTQPPSSPA